MWNERIQKRVRDLYLMNTDEKSLKDSKLVNERKILSEARRSEVRETEVSETMTCFVSEL